MSLQCTLSLKTFDSKGGPSPPTQTKTGAPEPLPAQYL